MLLRLLLTAALIGAAIWLWRNRRRQAKPAKPTEPASEAMLRCAHCGVHVPQRLALSAGTHHYCSQAHLQQGPSHSEH
jgi:uncharacterized protein